MPIAEVRWTLVVPVKRLALAKTRLGPPYSPYRRELALAFALDTTAAALATPAVAAVVAVTDEPEAARLLRALGAYVVADEPAAGLNPALRHGASVAAARDRESGTGALSADLPALRPEELGAVLAGAGALVEQAASAFLPDAHGSGTTLVLAGPEVGLHPLFGPDSALAHAQAGHAEITGGGFPTVRRDVDTAADLDAAILLGVGPHTSAALEPLASR